MRKLLATVLLLTPGLAMGVTGCDKSDDDVRTDYCNQVETDADEISRTVAEKGSAAFVEVLPTLEGLARKSPGDVRDEWQVFLNALRGLRDALEATGVKPEEVTGTLPAGLSVADRKRIQGAASVLAGDDVRIATQQVEQHALDVCHTPLL